jgi:hypothetical protein
MTRARDTIDALWGYTPFMVRWGRLGYFVALVGVVWCLLIIRGSTPFQDKWILLGIGSIFGLAALVMLIGTRYWTIRGLGLFGTLTADCLFYLAFAFPRWGWAEPPGNDYLSVVRALFITGGTLLLISLFMWLFRTRFGTRPEPDGVIV